MKSNPVRCAKCDKNITHQEKVWTKLKDAMGEYIVCLDCAKKLKEKT